jgi:DNA-binding NtrC family response regulator
LVEDENAVRIAAREFLQAKGYTVLDAPNAAEALLAHSRHDGPVHLLITDVVMPGMSGPDLAARLKQLDPALQVIYVSGYTDGAIASVAGVQQEAGFLQKPFALESLARKIRSALDAPGQKRDGD